MNFHNPGNRKVLLAVVFAAVLVVLALYNFFRSHDFLDSLIHFITLICGLVSISLMAEMVSDYTRVNEELADNDKARGEFITIASHQLRTPPATFKWYIAALASGEFGKLPEEAKSALMKMEAVNNSQIALIDDLLNTSRIERGTLEFLFEYGNLLELAQQTIDQLTPQAIMRKTTLVFEKPNNPLPDVVMDKEKIRQVLNNFIDNAMKYSGSSKVKIQVMHVGDNVRVEVTDAGKGISKEHMPYLFEKYNRGKDSSLHGEGLGIGLYVAKLIIQKHNGQIWAESEGEGKGAKFIFSLPLHNQIHANTSSNLSLGV